MGEMQIHNISCLDWKFGRRDAGFAESVSPVHSQLPIWFSIGSTYIDY